MSGELTLMPSAVAICDARQARRSRVDYYYISVAERRASMAVHSNHYGEGVLWDGCIRCDELSKTLYDLDDQTLQALARLAVGIDNRVIGMNESRAITHLKIIDRVVLRSKIRELV